jgi:hypothetical protein
MKITYNLAMAASRDAGNRHAKKAGRIVWNWEDWDCAADEFARLGKDWFDYQTCGHPSQCERSPDRYCGRCHSECYP